MPNYPYLIVGAGMTAAAAVAAIRETDRTSPIGMIGSETHPPYNRPPLSKALWKGDKLESIWRKMDGMSVTTHLGRTVKALDPKAKSVTDDQGTVHTYGKLLLATGCSPRRLPFGKDCIIYFRGLDDYERLRRLASKGARVGIIGGGFIGSELAAALAMNGAHPVLVFPNDAIGSRIYPRELAAFLSKYYREKGVEVVSGAKVSGCESHGGKFSLQLDGGRRLEVDGVVAGIGVEPNVELAKSAGLKIDNGIRVDSSLRTNDPNIYAAGDVASFHNPALNQWMRVEHEDNANTMGGFAGVAMSGRPVSYDHLPFFYSDLFDLGYEAVGELDSRLTTVVDWKTPFREGVIYYLKDARVRGVLLWNVWGQVDAARQLIAAPGPFTAKDLIGRLPK